LKNYERRTGAEGSGEGEESAGGQVFTSGIALPPNTMLSSALDITAERGVCLHLSISNDIPIRAVLLFGEGIFDSECYSM